MRRALLLALVGCSSPSSSTDIDAPPADDAAPPADAAESLDEYQRRIVGTLGGTVEIVPGVMLQHRASISERDYARTFLVDEFEALGIPVEAVAYTFDTRSGANVIATLPPTNIANVNMPPILVGAHFDGVAAGPGAADNATGVAIVLATARHLATLPRERKIIFALFDQEELGLIGSKAYASSLVTAGTTLRGAHIFDMLAWDGDGDHAVELWSASPELKTLYEAHGPAAGTPIQAVTFASSDHQAFLDRGFPAVGIGEEFVGGDHTPHYHKATDTVANVQFDHLAVVTQLALAALAADAAAQ